MAVRTPGIAHYGIVLAIVLISANADAFRIAAVLDAAEFHQCVLIRLDDGRELSVRPFDAATIKLEPTSQGLVIWSAGATEGWQYLPPGSSWSRPRFVDNRRSAQVLLQSTRGEEADSGGSPSGQTTVQLDQLLGQVVVRGKTFLTPHNGGILHGRITVRRAPQSTSPEFPPAVALLRQGNTELARISFEEDQRQVTYDQNPLQKQLPDGLPPGEYTLRMEEGSESSAFTVEDTEWRDAVMALPNRFADLLGSPTDPLYLQITAEYLLGQVDKNATPLPYLSDALDVLESVPPEQLTAYLTSVKESLLKRLSGGEDQPASPPKDATGIVDIDAARMLIATGNWQDALAKLQSDVLQDSPRAKALATLYRAVILSECGLGSEDEATEAFRTAIGELSDASPTDRYRAQNNFANFLLNKAQDRLNNHTFQMAAGGRQVLMTALGNWIDAEAHYQEALKLASRDDADQGAAVQVNLARLYALLADVIRTLDVPGEGSRQFVAGENAAAARARVLAQGVSQVSQIQAIDPRVLASAEEIQARLAFRSRQSEPCLSHARAALQAYLDAGAMSGVEGIQRLLGLYYLRADQFDREGANRAESRKQALKHFLLSHELSELLRDRIPPDHIGTSQAGFYARRAYVNEKIIELLIAEDKPAEALHYAELAKARSLQDLLAVERTQTVDEEQTTRTTEEILAHWPKDLAAIEYFIGTEKVWLFLIDTRGGVKVFDVLGEQRHSRDFIRDVRQFLDDTESQSGRMRRLLLSGKGFDHRWQDKLHEFFQQMMPAGVLDELRKAETVVVAPHHILHYFPFAALVTRCDERPRDAHEMVQPQFLIDEPFHLAYAPSLGVWDLLRSRPARLITQANAVGIVDFPGAPDLPGVEQDIANLKAAFGDMTDQVLFGAEASEENVRPILGREGLLLIASHGTNLADDPLSSHLLLLPDKDNDGRLTAKELFACQVHSDLIVMSACYSGLADRSPLPGDDLFGIQRALLQSGARTVVSGLWDVYDGTAPELMRGFFDRLAEGQSAPESLANSQRAFLKQRRTTDGDPWLHPYFWAVYTVAGDDRTQVAAK